jgi:tetratricopeptide (TPR) repeat protein
MTDPARAKAAFENAIARMRAGDAADAERICRAALADRPGDHNLLSLLGASLRRQQRLEEAEAALRRALARVPTYAKAHEELGTVLLLMGRADEARAHLERALALDPRLSAARLKLTSALAQSGRTEEARATLDAVFETDAKLRTLAKAAEHMAAGRLQEAERAYRSVLAKEPSHVDALRGLGNVASRLQRYREAVSLLTRVVRQAPDFAAAWAELGHAQLELDEFDAALASIERALALEPRNPLHQLNRGNVLARAGRQDAALAALDKALALGFDRPPVHLARGNVLKTIGRHDEAVAAYRRSVELRPDFGEGWWSLSNLKTFRFTDAEVAAMEAQLGRPGLAPEALVHFCFALGQAYESRGDYERAFEYFARGNAERRSRERYDPVQTELMHDHIIEVFSAEFLAAASGHGSPERAPILIVGLPRSGSTLIEQILASHSMVEGTHELPSLGRVVMSIGRGRRDGLAYPEAVRELAPADFGVLAQRYLDHTRRYRRGAPWFIDKMPNTFPTIGLWHLMFPHAVVIDARRDPLDTCMSCFKQLFAQGQSFTYDLFELGEYYRQYLRMMDHWDRVLTGRVLRVQYEDVVDDLEGQARRILSHCGLPWEDRCLRFHETERAVRTASSEQVRRPIYADSVGSWRRYAAHLEPLRAALELDE